MPAPTLQFKRGLLANLPGLQAGEPGFTTDSYEFYIGINSTTQENKFFGSHRYWTRGTASTGSGVNFVEGTNNGTQYITLKAADTLAGITTFVLPGADGTNGQILTTNGSGTLSFSSPASSSFTIAGGTGTDTFTTGETLTFAGTANEIETAVTDNQVQIGLPNNVIVGGALTVSGNTTLGDAGGDLITVVGVATFTTSNVYVNNQLFVGGLQVTGNGSVIGEDITTRNFRATGVSTFVGAVTFEGGTITLGDATTDNVVFTADVNSNITPNTDATFDFGIGAQRWRNANFSGIVTATTFVGALTGTASSTTNIPNLTGAITSVNTTTSLGSFSSSDLATALTDETGSGSAVFATSPTLVTPALGTPSSGTLTNCTSLPISGLTASTSTALGVGTLELGHATDTTLARSGAGVVTIEGVEIVTVSATQTLTNKTLTSPLLTTPSLGIATATSINVSGIASVTQLSLSGTNLIDFASAGTGNPAFTTRSVGTKVVLYPAISGSTVDYSLGISASTLWNSIPENNSSFNFKWFGAETEVASLSGIGSLSVAGDIKVGGNDIQASDGNTNITLTSNTLTAFAGDIRVNGNDIQASDGNANITLTSNTLTTFAGDIKVGGNDIQASDGTTAITLSGADVTVADDLTVGGNLYVNGSTTQVNTAALVVEDRTIDLGIVNGSAPSGNTTWDLGILFNYYSSAAAKKSAVIWEHADARFKFASVLAADTNGSTVDTPQLTVTTFAPIEIASLFVNDCAGASQVISCTGTTRNLENITVDCGSF